MHIRDLMKFSVAIAIVGVFMSASAGANTVATFADPAPNADGDFLFELSDTTLSAAWTGYGLDLITPGVSTVFQDATFVMSDLAVGGMGVTSGGWIEFYEAAADGGDLILRIDFNAGQLYQPYGFGANSLVVDGNVTFSGPIIMGPLIDEQFAFSFANQQETATGYTWTAAFTSSATIPEPSAIGLLVIGSAILTLRRRG